jgi:hypothetical protein
LSRPERDRYLDLCGAYVTVLRPGETLYIPAAWWHYVEYVTDGGGFNLRLGRPTPLKQLFRVCDVLPARCRPFWRMAALALPLGSAGDRAAGARHRIADCYAALRNVRRGDPDTQAVFLRQVEALLRGFPPPREPFVRQGDPPDPFESLRLAPSGRETVDAVQER